METIEVLLVEDSPGDVSLTREALKEATVPNRLSVVEDGEAALRYLRREGEFTDAPPVNLVLLDLNLPKRDGREVLGELKADPELRRTPVIVLTTSAEQADIEAAYDRHANAYVTKPVSYPDFVDALRALERFWLQTVHLPVEG